MSSLSRILVVDDDSHLRRATVRVLSRAGHQVIEARDGRGALREARMHHPDLILLDVVLPDLDGVEVCQRIKADPALAGCMVILASGLRTASDDSSRGLEAGADGYIVRPVSNRELAARAGALLRVKRAEDRVARLHRVLRAINNVNQLIVRERDRDRLLQGACEILIATRDYRSAWILLLSPSSAPAKAFAACSTADAAAVVARLEGEGLPPCGRRALDEKRVVVTQNPEIDCAGCSLLDSAEDCGALTAVLERGQVYGLICAFVPAEMAADAQERALFKEVAEDLGLALHNLELDRQRRRTEASLRESEARYRLLFEGADVLVSVYNREGVCQLMNRKVAALFGGRPQDFVGRSFAELHPERGDEYVRRIQHAIDSGESREYEDEVVFAGTSRWLVSKVHPVRDANGAIVAAQILSHDVTERKRAEEALRESEARYRITLGALNEGLYDWNMAQGTVVFSPSYATMLGYDPDEFESSMEAYEALLHPDDRARSQENVRRFVQGQADETSTELRMRAKDGSYRWVLSRGRVVERDRQGRPLRMVGTNLDITERKRAEEGLRDEAARWQATFGAMRDAVWLLDDEWRILRCNRATEGLIGKPESEILGRTCWEVVHGRSEPIPECPVSRMKHSLKRESATLAWGDKWLEVTVDPLLDRSGRLRGAVHIMTDVTQRVAHEAALQGSLAEKELLLRELYHRTKNNMQVIQAMLELEAGYFEDERVHRAFLQTESRIQAMALVHEKLYQSQHLSRLDLSDYVQSLADLLFDTYRLTSSRVDLDIEMEPVLTLIDIAVPCGLVVNELVANALEHAFPGGREGKIHLALRRSGPGELELVVRDDGVGLPEGFDPRASESFGLLAVHSIVEHQLQGQVSFSTGGGVTCRVRFRDDLYQERL